MKATMKVFVICFICLIGMVDCTPRYSQADSIRNDGQTLTLMIDDISKLTPDQLLALRDLQGDMLDSGEKLTEMGVNASVQIRKAEEDRKLASRVVWAAFFFVGMIVIAALTPHFLRKK